MFPLSDDNPRIHPPIATVALIALNVASWLLLQGLGTEPALGRSVCLYGLIPGDLLGTAPAGSSFRVSPELACVLDGNSNWLSLVSSMFMHGGWFHIIGNMWFLWVFGDNIEDVMGPVRFVAFYVICGLAAAAAQILSSPDSVIPMVGASGAIGGVMGAYALLYPRARIFTFIFLGFYMTTIAVPALLMLGYWFLLQLLGGLPTLGGEAQGGVAFWAHAGGFLAGLALAYVFTRPDYLRKQRAAARRPRPTGRWL